MSAGTTTQEVRSTAVVAMLFTDIEGSTRLARRLGDAWPAVLEDHRSIARAALGGRGGRIVGTEGDSIFAVFDDPLDALRAAYAFQVALDEAPWPLDGGVRVRIGLHVGSVTHVGADYIGTEVHRAARIGAGAHGGQVLVSEAARELLGDRLPPELGLRELGRYRLKDFEGPAAVYQLLGPGLTADFPPIRLTELDPTNLPIQATSFIGRDEELARVIDLIGSARLLTLVGTGGIGKTRLMLEAGGRLLDRFPDGVWLVELASLGDPALVPDAVARAIRSQDQPGRDVPDTITDFLRAKSVLLLFDNCEHLVDAAADLVSRLLAACPGLLVITSSREALNLAGEVVFEVPPLGMDRDAAATRQSPADEDSAQAALGPGARLFIERARSVRSSFDGTGADAARIAEICRRLDGIPLAIELAASRVTTMSVDEIATGLDHRLRLLTGGRRSAVARQQTLRGLFDWSWDLLGDSDRQLLAGLSVFANGWTLDAAAAVTRSEADDAVVGSGTRSDPSVVDILDGLARLAARSLVIAEPGTPTRYRLLETVREYAADRAEAAHLTELLRERHLGFYLDLVESIEPGLRGPEMVPLLGRLDADIDNLRVALDTAAHEPDPGRMLRTTLALAAYWRSRAVGSEHLVRLASAADVVMARSSPGVVPDHGDAVLWAQVLAAAAMAHAVYGDIEAARAWSDRGIEIVGPTHHLVAMMAVVGARGVVSVFAGETMGQPELIDEIRLRAAEAGDSFVIALNESGAALRDLAIGDVGAAEAKLATATDAATRTGNPYVIAFVALSRGRVAGFQGRLDEARRWFDEAIAAWELMGDRRFVLVSQSDLAHALRQGGALDEAEALYRRTLREWLYLGNRGAVANQLEAFAFLALAREDPVRAARLIGAAEAIREDVHAAMLPVERYEYAAAISRLHDEMAPEEFERELAAGGALSYDSAVAMVTSEQPPV